MTPQRAREIISSQSMRGFGAEIEMTDDERREIWALVEAAPISMSVRDMVCRIARGDPPDRFAACLMPGYSYSENAVVSGSA
jgi:hypothetical protein